MGSPLQEKSKAFALQIIKVCNEVKREKRESVLTNQLVRSGTSVGANIREVFYYPRRLRQYGASGRNRTNDTRIFSPLLYLLSYRGVLRNRYCADAKKNEIGDPERTRTVDLQRDRLAC